jgi:hypothetical protein
MQYKGDDLDLRVPNVRVKRETREILSTDYDAAANGRVSRAVYSSSANGPIWVDEVVLQCCNYAYDMAAAHAAGEVGLEHLVHALTRVDAAARVLEQRGVREGQLRRESAALLASEIPTSQSSERSLPRRSPEFEDVLRRATEIAGRRGLAASIDDVLLTLLTWPRDVPAVVLLRRMAPDWQRAEWTRQREVVVEAQRVVEAPRTTELVPRYGSYIGAIEDGLRALHSEIANERKVLAELIRDIQRDVVAQRTDHAAFRGDLSQRIETLERSVQVRSDVLRLPAQVAERMQTLEKAVHGGLGEGARNWAALGQRLQALETALASRGGSSELQPLVDRIASLEASIDGHQREVGRELVQDVRRGTEGLGERLTQIERLVSAGAGEGGRHWTSLSERMGAIEAILNSRTGDAAGDLVPLMDRLDGLERAVRSGFGDAVGMTTLLTERVEAMEKLATGAAGSGPSGEMVARIEQRLEGLERMIDSRTGGVEARIATIAQGQAFDPSLILRPVGEALVRLRTESQERGGAVLGQLATAAEKMAALEQANAAAKDSFEAVLKARDREVSEMHEAIVRLAENQHTLASAIADWRLEVHTDFGEVNNRIERILAPPPVKVAEIPAENALKAAGVRQDGAAESIEALEDLEPDSGKRGFWYWLFGTNSVRKANRAARLGLDRFQQQLKDARARRQGDA